MARERPKTKEAQIALLKERIAQSGLSVRQFAIMVMIRDDRTVRRWLAGDSPIPNLVMDFLTDPWEVPWPRQDIPS
jgi:hypothetical protein